MAISLAKNEMAAKNKLILVGFIALLFTHVLLVFAGMYGNDDINYARHAANIAAKGIDFSPASDQFQLRWSTIYSTAFFYKLFGINSISSSLCALLSFSLCGFILYKILRNSQPVVLLITLTLFFFGHSVIFYSHRLLPDPAMCLATLWMYFSYRNFTVKKQRSLWNSLQFSMAFFLALITKETIIIILPLFLFFFTRDIIKKQRVEFWKYAAIFSGVSLIAYMSYFKITTGDFFYRYHVLQLQRYLNECSFDTLPLAFTIRRIAYELWKAMLLNGDMMMLLPAVTAAWYHKKKYDYNVRRMDIFSFLFLAVCANFMTISFSSYIPLCHDPRHFLFLLPFAAIIAGPFLTSYFRNPLQFIALPVFFTGATATIFLLQGGATKYIYLLLTLLFVSRYIIALFSKTTLLYFISTGGFIAIFSINYFIDFLKPMYPYYWDQQQVIKASFTETATKADIYAADDFTAELSEYFLNFQTGNLHFLPLDSAKNNSAQFSYFLVNAELTPAARGMMDSLQQNGSHKNILTLTQQKNVILYKIDSSVLQLIFHNLAR